MYFESQELILLISLSFIIEFIMQKVSKQEWQHKIASILTYTHNQSKYKLAIRTDQERSLYLALLNCIATKIQKNRSESTIFMQHRQTIQQSLHEFGVLLRRQCEEKGNILDLILHYYRGSMMEMQSMFNNKMQQYIKEYGIILEQRDQKSKIQLKKLIEEVELLRKEKQEKWKTLYLIVRDNRVLRRQKGKLLRVVNQERLKLLNIEEELVEVAREGEKHKLLANYQQNSTEHLKLYLQNHQSIDQLQKFMKHYPKHRKKMLKMQLKQLQNNEQQTLDQKIEFVIKNAKESEQIFDEFEDVHEIYKSKTILYNASTQTSSFDIGQQPFTQHNLTSILVQTEDTKQSTLQYASKIISVCFHIQKKKQSVEKDYIQKIEKEDKHEVKDFIKIPCRFQPLVYNLTITNRFINSKNNYIEKKLKNNLNIFKPFSFYYIDNCIQDYKSLPTKYRLSQDMKRGKEISKKQLSRKQSLLMNSSSQISSSGQLSSALQKKRKGNLTYQSPDERDENSSFSDSEIQDFSRLLNKVNTDIKRQINPDVILRKTFDKNLLKYSSKRGTDKKHLISIIKKVSNRKDRSSVQNSLISPSQHRISAIAKVSNEKVKLFTSTASKFHIKKKSESKFNPTVILANSKPISPIEKQIKGRFSRNRFQLKQDSQRNIINKQIKIIKRDRWYETQVKSIRQKSNHRKVNLAQNEGVRLAHKIIKNIFQRRKEIFHSNYNLQSFIRSYVQQNYGLGSQINFISHCNLSFSCFEPLSLAFEVMLDTSVPPPYLQDIFIVFTTILELNQSQCLITNPLKAECIFKHLISQYISKENLEQLMIKHSKLFKQESVDVACVFLVVESYLKQWAFRNQTYEFFRSILPLNQYYMSFIELRQFLYLFRFDSQYYEHLSRFKQIKNGIIPLHSIILYAKRFNWTSLMNIREYIRQQFELLWPNYDQVNNPMDDWYDSTILRKKLLWMNSILKRKEIQLNHNDFSKCFELRELSQIIESNYAISVDMPISELLIQISIVYNKSKLKQVK